MSALCPYKCTGIIAFVLFVMFLSISSGSILNVTGSISVKIGIAPIRATTPAVAKNENVGSITSSPGLISIAIRAMSSASVPEETPIACLHPK